MYLAYKRSSNALFQITQEEQLSERKAINTVIIPTSQVPIKTLATGKKT